MKRRIESLLQGGKVKEAIALAEKANLVCRGTAFIAWDDAEEVAIAQDEVYQPSFDIPSGLPSSVDSMPQVAFMPAPRASWNSALAARSDREPVSDIVNLEESKRLTERLSRAIESVFCADDAKKLTGIVLDWARHIGEKQVIETLRVLLRKCERDGDVRYLTRVFSKFFLSLPDPWKTKASSILSAPTVKTSG
jgi:hypothetical protein